MTQVRYYGLEAPDSDRIVGVIRLTLTDKAADLACFNKGWRSDPNLISQLWQPDSRQITDAEARAWVEAHGGTL